MARTKKDRTQYDLQAWELLMDNPTVVIIMSDTNGQIKSVQPCTKVSFMPCDIACDSRDFYEIVGFTNWLIRFNHYHKSDCKTWDDVKDLYRKGGALHW